jgi:hypothetical protein
MPDVVERYLHAIASHDWDVAERLQAQSGRAFDPLEEVVITSGALPGLLARARRHQLSGPVKDVDPPPMSNA